MGAKLILVIVGLVVISCEVASASRLLGGLNENLEPTEDVKKLVQEMLPQVNLQAGQEFKSIKPIEYRVQIVAGTNYFIKAVATDASGKVSHVHLRIYKSFNGNSELTSIKKDVKPTQLLEYF